MEGLSLDNTADISQLSLQDGSDNPASEKLTKAYECYVAGRYQDALDVISGDLKFQSSSYGQVLAGNCHKKLGHEAQAMECWHKATEISPLEAQAYINIGNVLYSKGETEKAILNWHIAASVKPESPVVNLNLAIAYDKKNSRIKSTKYFEKYLKYNTNKESGEYIKIKRAITKLTAKTEFYLKKAEEYKKSRDLQKMAAVYLMLISTYANLPNIYLNIASIFMFDRNYEKALEFYLVVYLNFAYTNSTIMNIANLYYILGHKSYAYCHYSRVFKLLPEGTSYWKQVKSKLNELTPVIADTEIHDAHLNRAREYEADNAYEEAIDEYENYLILTDSENPEIQQIIDRYKIFLNPEPFVINVLCNQINELMMNKKLHACIDVCDRIMAMAENHTKEMMYAMKCKTECRKVILAREQFGVG